MHQRCRSRDLCTQDQLGLAGGLTFGQLTITAVGTDTQIAIATTNEVLSILTSINPLAINASDFISV
ncbi:MAG: hypothetical protein RMY36_009665 [Nostoc sp. SerVER01]